MNNQGLTVHLCADASHKLIQHGFPVLIVITTDKANQFHHFSLAMCCHEKDEAFKFIFNSEGFCKGDLIINQKF